MARSLIPVGTHVLTAYGHGRVKERRSDGSLAIVLQDWTMPNMPNHTPVYAYLPGDQVQRVETAVERGCSVTTPFGLGIVRSVRPINNMCVVDLSTSWKLTGKYHASVSLKINKISKVCRRVQTPFGPGTVCAKQYTIEGEEEMLRVCLDWQAPTKTSLSQVAYASVPAPTLTAVLPHVLYGERVCTPLGKGVVESVRPSDGTCVVALDWDNKRSCMSRAYVPQSSVLVVRGRHVNTAFGTGIVECLRDDGMYVVALEDWKLNASKLPVRMVCESVVFVRGLHPIVNRMVKTAFGLGVVKSVRTGTDMICCVHLMWSLEGQSNHIPAIVFLKASDLNELVRDVVFTPLGTGVVTYVRDSGLCDVVLDPWGSGGNAMRDGKKVTKGSSSPVRIIMHGSKLTSVLGVRVNTCCGDGVVVGYRSSDSMFVVKLTKYAMGGKRPSYAYISRVSPASATATATPYVQTNMKTNMGNKMDGGSRYGYENRECEADGGMFGGLASEWVMVDHMTQTTVRV